MKRVLITVCFLLCTLSAFAFETYKDAIRAAKTTKDKGELATIYSAAYELANNDRDKAAAAYNAGLNYKYANKPATAIEYFEKVVALPRDRANHKALASRRLIELYIVDSKFDKAQNACLEYLKKPVGPKEWQDGVKATLERIPKLKITKQTTNKRSALRYIAAIHGSENHEIQRLANILMTAQILKNSPRYKNKELDNGETLQKRYDRWNTFYKARWDGMAKHGLLAEAFADYGVYTLPEIFNMAEYAEDPALKKKSEMLLHAIWTEWAIGQLNGIRGGGRVRIYQGDESKRTDNWERMSAFFFDRPWHMVHHPDPLVGWPRIFGVSKYRVPDIIKDIAHDTEGKGEYVYVGKRPGRVEPIPFNEVPVWWSPWYNLTDVDTRMLAYDYCTPDYVMGSLLIDPTLGNVSAHDYLRKNDMGAGYTALTGQNRYQAIVFPSGARIVPQCLHKNRKNGMSYLQHQSVQHKNIWIVQKSKQSNLPQMSVAFGGKGMKDRLIEKEGWLMLAEGKAFLAVKAFSPQDGKSACGHEWSEDNVWMHLYDSDAPVVFVMARQAQFADLDAFSKYVLSSRTKLKDEKFTFKIKDVDGTGSTLSLYLGCTAIPEVNGQKVSFLPEKVYVSPFFSSKHGSGVITIQKDDKKLILDFNNNTSTEVYQ